MKSKKVIENLNIIILSKKGSQFSGRSYLVDKIIFRTQMAFKFSSAGC